MGLFGKKKEKDFKTIEMLEEFKGENGDGLELFNQQQFEEALNYFDHQLNKYPKSVYYKEGKARALSVLGKDKDAIKYLDDIIKTFDKYLKEHWFTSADLFDVTFRTLYNKARLSSVIGKEADVQRCYEKAKNCIDVLIELSTKNPYGGCPDRLWIFKARVHAILQEYDRALDFLQKSVILYKSEGEDTFGKFKKQLLNEWLDEFGKLKDDPKFKALIE